MSQNPKEADPNTCEGMNLLARTSRWKDRFLLQCPLYRLPTEDVVQFKDEYYYLKRWIPDLVMVTCKNDHHRSKWGKAFLERKWWLKGLGNTKKEQVGVSKILHMYKMSKNKF